MILAIQVHSNLVVNSNPCMSKHTVKILFSSIPLLTAPAIIITMPLKRLDPSGMVKNHYFLHHFVKQNLDRAPLKPGSLLLPNRKDTNWDTKPAQLHWSVWSNFSLLLPCGPGTLRDHRFCKRMSQVYFKLPTHFPSLMHVIPPLNPALIFC